MQPKTFHTRLIWVSRALPRNMMYFVIGESHLGNDIVLWQVGYISELLSEFTGVQKSVDDKVAYILPFVSPPMPWLCHHT